MLASRRAVPEFPSPSSASFRCGQRLITRGHGHRGKGPRAQAPAVHRAGGGQHCGLCNLWMEKRFHARTSTSSSTFPSPSGRPSPQFNSSHTFGPPVSCFPPTLFCLSVVPLLPPPKSRRCNRSRRTLRPPAGSPSLVPASLPASLPLSTTSAGQRRGILEYYGTAVPLFLLLPISLALLAWERCCMRRRSSDQRRVDQRRLD